MALHRGVQSAIFYYLSCAPCSERRYRKKRREEARRDRVDKDHLETLMPDLYRHPSPSTTNRHWDADIALGPRMVRRKGKSERGSKRSQGEMVRNDVGGSAVPSDVTLPRLTSAGQGSDTAEMARMKSSGSRGANGSKTSFGTTRRTRTETWESGKSSTSEPLNASANSIVLRRPATARTTDSTSSYQSFRNPQVNDRHPAVVTKVHSREDVSWMLQPPPPAELMGGRQHPSDRSRSVSGASKPSISMASSAPMSRQTSDRPLDHRLPSTETLQVPYLSRETSQRHERSANSLMTDERDFAASARNLSKRRPSPIEVTQPSEESDLTVIRRHSARPQLSTIVSDIEDPDTPPNEDGHLILRTRSEYTTASNERDRLERRSALVKPYINTQIVATAKDEDVPELFDSWYTPEFELGQWVHEHTKREGVRQRWSMDL